MTLRVLVTGANRGLGLELVQQYVRDGAIVFAAARQPYSGALERLAKEHAERLFPVPLDVTQASALPAAVAAVRAHTDALDVLINNAGVNPRSVGLGRYERAQMLETLDINAVAPILVAQAFLDLLQKGTQPKLVNISSQIGSFGWNQHGMAPLYAASKAALNMYTRALANEAGGVITVAVHPGWVQTDMGGQSATLTPAQSVSHLRTLIARLKKTDSGQFFNYDGKPHPF